MQNELLQAAKQLAEETDRLHFSAPVEYIYNPLVYAWDIHAEYLERYGSSHKKILFLGMNPGPFGMAQNGIPFGEIPAVRDWMQLKGKIGKPEKEHPKRPIEGFDCSRSEVSGRRLWGLMKKRWGSPESFFRSHFVANFCPLVFMDAGGRNITPNQLKKEERKILLDICGEHLHSLIRILQPEWLIGVGKFAEEQALRCVRKHPGCLSREQVQGIMHPSPANPQANRGWEDKVRGQLEAQGIWEAITSPETEQ
ncbi:uracil-DNA glycosylase family protein [Spirochaeta dissipatitropha]